jgi:putative membrane protein
MMGWGWGWHGMGLGWLVPLGLICLVVYILVHGITGHRRPCCSDKHEDHGTDTSKALEILAERFAKGEINDEEYKQKKAELKK